METVQLTRIFKALSCEQRFNLFLLLADWCRDHLSTGEGMEKCFTRACEELQLSRSTISHHFRELEEAGLIESSRIGQTKISKINPDAISAIRQFLERADGRNHHAQNGA